MQPRGPVRLPAPKGTVGRGSRPSPAAGVETETRNSPRAPRQHARAMRGTELRGLQGLKTPASVRVLSTEALNVSSGKSTLRAKEVWCFSSICLARRGGQVQLSKISAEPPQAQLKALVKGLFPAHIPFYFEQGLSIAATEE